MAQYHIYQLETGYNQHLPPGLEKEPGFDPNAPFRSPFSMALLSGEGRHILVDCGIDLENPKSAQRVAYEGGYTARSATEILAPLDLAPEDISDIILTHLHWDHIGGMKQYPNATFYLQKEEFFGWLSAFASPATRGLSQLTVLEEDLKTLTALLYQGRLLLLEGDVDELFPGIRISVSTFGHSYAMQLVLLEQEDGSRWAMVGDLATGPKNFTTPGFLPHTMFSVGGVVNILRDYERLMTWMAGDVSHILMAHDGSWQFGPSGQLQNSGLYLRQLV